MQLLVPLNSVGTYESQERVGEAFFLIHGREWGMYGGGLEVALRVRSEGVRCFVDVELRGYVRVECDRCLELFDCPMEFGGRLDVSRELRREVEMDGDEWHVPLDLEQLDVAPYVLESVYLSLPMRRYHGMEGTDEGDCDPAMRSYIAREESKSQGSMAGQLGDLLRNMNTHHKRCETD